MQQKKVLDIQKLTFKKEITIVNEIDWTVFEGQRWVLLGANGSGKTSLISTICAYNTPSSGVMIVDGQQYSTFNWQKMRERIALVGSQLKRNIDKDEKVVDVIIGGKFAQINYFGEITKELVLEAYEQMERFGIEYLVDSDWFTISQGERQKVLLARAMMLKPAIIFLDEPCTGLDPIARKEFMQFLDSLCKDDSIPSIIMTTHYVEEIPTSFSHAMIIKKGSVLAQGDINKVMTSKNLSEAYSAPCTLIKNNGLFNLSVD